MRLGRESESSHQILVTDGFAGAAFIVAALQPAIAEQNGLDTRFDHRVRTRKI